MATTPLTPTQIAVLTKRLADAEDAYHNLNVGRSARVVVDQNGERVEFTAANRAGLYNYIMQLKSQLPAENGGGFCPGGPATFIF